MANLLQAARSLSTPTLACYTEFVRILISNDDGIYADGIWALAHEFKRIGEVIIVAPDREQSAVGTAVSLRKPLRVQQIVPLIQDIPSLFG